MQLLCLGLNHNTAPLAVRERVAFGPDELEPSLRALLQQLSPAEAGGVSEAMILSTCNRTELYCAAGDAELAAGSLVRAIADRKGISAAQLEPHLFRHVQSEAARHLYRVVCGADSMVLGETQIVGQFKKAVASAGEAKTLGLLLNHAFQEAFAVAKEVRSSTAIGSSSVSLAAAAVRLACRLFGKLSGENVLFIGAGEMIELCAAHFGAQSPKSVTVANRSVDRGQALAARYNGQAIRLQELPDKIAQFDVIVSCTASALPIVGLGMISRAIKERRHRPMCIIDLAVPRDVEPEVAKLPDVYVYSMDELGAVVQSGRESRQAALAEAESIISEHVRTFEEWLAMRAAVPVIASIRKRAEVMRQQALAQARRQLAAGADVDAVLEQLALGLTNKLVHPPTVLLRDAKGLTALERIHVQNVLGKFFEPR
ncbi:MAG: glutamyl-tRNA reductase [Duodenibacillus sp.]|nr:glutamyl-tRNA reductase [Duodenibacillus sp.]